MGVASIDPAASYEAATIRYTITSLPCHHGSPLLRGTVVKRRSVFDRRTFRPAIDLQKRVTVTTYVGKPSAVGQPTRPT